MISAGDGVGSHKEAYGNDAKKAHIFSAVINPKLPAINKTFARAGNRGMHKLAIRPRIRDQKQMRGSTSKLLNSATGENRLK
jgi:hypothetical protein